MKRNNLVSALFKGTRGRDMIGDLIAKKMPFKLRKSKYKFILLVKKQDK